MSGSNPRIEAAEGATVYEEGCLSFPGIYAKVERHDRFQFRWCRTNSGRSHERPFDVSAGDFLRHRGPARAPTTSMAASSSSTSRTPS